MLKFSIIVPFYQVPESYFRMCMDSILRQSYKNFEVILVSDGAPEDILTLCKEYAAQDLRIRILEQENQGVSAARNAGIDEAVGEWIMFVDADDWIEPAALERFNYHIDQTGADFIFGGYYKEYANRQVAVKSQCYLDGNTFIESKGQIELQKMIFASPLFGDSGRRATMYRSVWGGVISSQLIKDHHIRFDVALKQNEDVLYRLYVAGKSICSVYVSEMLYHYRNYDSSASIRFREDAVGNFQMTAEKISAYLIKEGTQELFKEEYSYRILEICNGLAKNYFFHKDNQRSRNEKRTIANRFYDSSFFRDAIASTTYKRLPWKRKIQIGLLKHHCYALYNLAYTVFDLLFVRKRYG